VKAGTDMKFQAMLNATLFLLAIAFSSNCLAGDPSDDCMARLKSNDELQILNGKIAVGITEEQTLEILSNDDLPTKKEKEAISIWVKERQICKHLGDEWRSKNYPPTVIPIVDGCYSDLTSLTADLYARKISYGDFAKRRAKIDQECKKSMADEAQLVNQQLHAEKLEPPESEVRSLDAATIRKKRLAE
jgi:hypothetical protein